MLIGEVADKAAVTSQTIRFYERLGLLPAPRRGANGYRHYDVSTLTRLQFIKTGQSAGLILIEIRSIAGLRDAGQTPCAHVSDLLDQKLHRVRAQQQELAALESELNQLLDHSRRLDPRDCSEEGICHILSTPTSRLHE